MVYNLHFVIHFRRSGNGRELNISILGTFTVASKRDEKILEGQSLDASMTRKLTVQLLNEFSGKLKS